MKNSKIYVWLTFDYKIKLVLITFTQFNQFSRTVRKSDGFSCLVWLLVAKRKRSKIQTGW
ncbi:MAG: hypothetical protein LBJ74_02985 [Heliobacteriaceae bacterium]|nr:hypothetical protein [Heliobacteriaceae bacterium]